MGFENGVAQFDRMYKKLYTSPSDASTVPPASLQTIMAIDAYVDGKHSSEHPVHINRRNFILRGIVGCMASIISAITAKSIYTSLAREEVGATMEDLVRNFPRHLDGAMSVTPFPYPGSNKAIVVIVIDHEIDPSLVPQKDTQERYDTTTSRQMEERCFQQVCRIIRDIQMHYPEYDIRSVSVDGLHRQNEPLIQQYLRGQALPPTVEQRLRTFIEPLRPLLNKINLRCIDSPELCFESGKAGMRLHSTGTREAVDAFFSIQREREDRLLQQLNALDEPFPVLLIGKSHLVDDAFVRLIENSTSPPSAIFIVPEGVTNSHIDQLNDIAAKMPME